MNQYEILSKSIDFATNQLEDYKSRNNIGDISAIVITSLYRKQIELCEGVRVSATNGLNGPALLNYRSLIEANLAFKYILRDPEFQEDRAKAYKIGYHKHEIKAAELLKELSPDKNFENRKQLHQKELDKDELKDVLEKYDDLQNNNDRIPKWYALNGGPRSIDKLAKLLTSDDDGKRELMSKQYGFLSTGAHNYMALDSVFEENGSILIKPIKASFNPNEDNYNLGHTRSLLTKSMVVFTLNFFPDYKNELLGFVQQIEPYIRKK